MILSNLSYVVFVDSSLWQQWCSAFSPLKICGIFGIRQSSIIPSLFSPYNYQAYLELKVFQGCSILTWYVLPIKTRILGGEIIPLDHDVHMCGPIYVEWVCMW
jgi:hypothetical protein